MYSTNFKILLFLQILLFSNIDKIECSARASEFNNFPKWMSKLPDDLYLSQLSLPGTHQTMAKYGGALVKTQNLNLNEQLNAGIRVLDIRCRHIKNSCAIHHGLFYQKANLHDVLKTIVQFLEINNSELILMRLKEEFTSSGNTQSLIDTIGWYLNLPEFSQFIWKGNFTIIPKVGAVRGKIIILDQIKYGKFGLNWFKCSNCIQDDYKINSLLPFDINRKWKKVLQNMEMANEAAGNLNIYINFLTGSSATAFPSHIAGKVNKKFIEYLRTDILKFDKIGAILMDFPKNEQILQIISINFKQKSGHVVFYEKEQFSGQSKTFIIISESCTNLQYWDNKVSSLVLIEGCLLIFEKNNCLGNFISVNESIARLSTYDFNDKITSITNC